MSNVFIIYRVVLLRRSRLRDLMLQAHSLLWQFAFFAKYNTIYNQGWHKIEKGNQGILREIGEKSKNFAKFCGKLKFLALKKLYLRILEYHQLNN